MRSTTFALLAGAGLLALASGCNKPKDTCEGTLHSLEGCINSNDWECFQELMHPAQRKKFGDKMIRNWAKDQYMGARSFKFTKINANESPNICIAQTLANYEIKVRGKQPEPHDDEYTAYTLHPQDGIWYLDVPGSQKLGGF